MTNTTRRLRMRSGHVAVAVVRGLFVASVCSATSVPLGPPVALGPGSLEVEMERNPELASLIARRGYPDWAERVEVDSEPPLDPYEIRVFYLRFDREVAFARASILGRPLIGVRKFDRPIAPAREPATLPITSRASPSTWSARSRSICANNRPGVPFHSRSRIG